MSLQWGGGVVCKFLHLKAFNLNLKLVHLTVQLLPILCKTFLKTPENLQRDKWYVVQITVLVVLYFLIFLKQFHPYDKVVQSSCTVVILLTARRAHSVLFLSIS